MTAPNGSLLSAPPEVRGKRVLVYSLGIEGRDLAGWLLANGATVVISDTRSDEALAAAGAHAPRGVLRLVSGEPLLDPSGYDLVAVSQSVLRYNPALQRARELGIPVTSQMRLFMQLCPGKTVGITGSSGKSTTTALVGGMAREAGIDSIVGGNIGEALLGHLSEISPDTTVILEISHTQLQYTDRSPAIAAITNITPNHLDQFSWDEYVGLKRNILTHQRRGDSAVLNADDKTSRALMASVKGRLVRASILEEQPGPGAWVERGEIVVRGDGRPQPVLPVEAIRLRGQHNLANVTMACAIASEAGIPRDAMARAIRAFTGVPHRLEVVGSVNGAAWVNDSIATSPERTIAGLRAFSEPVVLLLGGRDKNLDLDGLRELARSRCRTVVCFGESGDLFCTAMRGAVADCTRVNTLDEAVALAATRTAPGDVVLLSPAGTSFDAYPNFEVRGEAFRAVVRALPGFTEEVSP
ncbi:MAG: UDP-N-acetylmuramoyl-L-alanine--D-glutamate ligase [Dehalococcoidia bacterium]|jgi:UDP-N-acetylmuramoylalanine--D-glutamate ligase|nr:UDP-N-acetylmuramoyl-L-alanine--D-glutamate ligase [Dehalococcoidia bacterium]